MAAVIFEDLGMIIQVPVGTATAFRQAINNNFTVLKNSSKQLQDIVGQWNSTHIAPKVDKTISQRLYGSNKLYVGTQTQYNSAISAGLDMIQNDVWFKVI